MIRSLHIIGSKGSGGAERFYMRLVEALHRRGHPTLAINPPNSEVARDLTDGVLQKHIPMRSVMDLVSRWKIQREINKFKPDIVQTYMGRSTRLTHLKRGRGPVHVARLGGYYNLKGYRHAHAWVGNTQGIHDYLVKSGLPEDRVFQIGNFVPAANPAPRETISALRASLNIADNASVVVAIGRLHPVKGFEDLLTAFSLLRKSAIAQLPYLVIAGDGPIRDSLHNLAKQLGIESRVRWCGWQSDPGPTIELADVMVCPSRYEPLGNVILESWNHGKPIISTDTDGGIELITEGINGLLVPREDPQRLAEKIDKLLCDTQLRQQLAQAGSATIDREFSEEKIISDYIDMYTALDKSP